MFVATAADETTLAELIDTLWNVNFKYDFIDVSTR